MNALDVFLALHSCSPKQLGVVPDHPLVVHVLTWAPDSIKPTSQEYTATHLYKVPPETSTAPLVGATG